MHIAAMVEVLERIFSALHSFTQFGRTMIDVTTTKATLLLVPVALLNMIAGRFDERAT